MPTGSTVPTTPTTPTPTEPTAPEPPKYNMVTVENGESIARLAKKYGVSEKEIIELNRDQLKYFKSATNCDDNKKYLGFLVGARIKLPENANQDAVQENQKTNSEIENAKYRKASKKLDGKLCPERTKTYKPLDENFRKKHNIRTTDELAAEQQRADEQQNNNTTNKNISTAAKPKAQSAKPQQTQEEESYWETFKKKGLSGVFNRFFD